VRRIALTGVRKDFGDVTALAGIDLTVDAGESVVVLGPSGCGKTTLLRIIAGLETASAGSVSFDDELQTGVPPHQRDVAIVFQHFALYPHLTAEENITLGLRHGLGMSRGEAAARAAEIAARLDILDLLQRQPRELSGGERQRVALGRALARNSGIVLLDEPLTGLDAQLRARLRVEIAATIRATGATVLHVTHDQLDAMAMADRIVVLNQGRVEQVGTPEEVYREPTSRFVARFVGSPPMNLFPGGTVGVGNSDETVGVRPEDLVLSGDDEVNLTGTVVATELNGANWTVYVQVGEVIVAAVSGARPPNVGMVTTLSSPAAAWHHFYGEGGRRMTPTP
jgi:multiple sugar transport system ATP-binding protein